MTDTFEITIPSRKIWIYYFITPLFVAFAVYANFGLIGILQSSTPLIGKIIMFAFFLIPVYIGLTCIIALLWILIGKEHISVDDEYLTIKKRILFVFNTNKYKLIEINEIHVNSNDYFINKITKGRNDFLSVFKFGTIHFKYSNKLIHIAGGLNDNQANEFLDKLLPIANKNKNYT